jgi:hypothetical protein
MKEAKVYYKKKYSQEDLAERLKRDIRHRMRTKRLAVGRKLAYMSSIAAAAMLMLVGLSFYSPQVARVAAKIPYFHLLFESKPITEDVAEALTSMGYPFDGMNFTQTPKKVAQIVIKGDQEYVSSVTPEVTEVVEELLKAKSYDTYEVEVIRGLNFNHQETLTLKEKKELAILEKAQAITETTLSEYGYLKQNFSAGQSDQMGIYMTIFLPHTENSWKEIQQKVQTGFDANQLDGVSLKIELYDQNKLERDQRWQPVIDTIAQGLSNNQQYQVTEVYPDLSKEVVILNVKTDISPSDENYKSIIHSIESDILEFMNSSRIKGIIHGEEYTVRMIPMN